MKKMLPFVLIGMFLPAIAGAEEMVVNLRSGNSLVIQYTGSIQGVTLRGDSDAITGMNMASGPAETGITAGDRTGRVEGPAAAPPEEKGGKGGGFQLKWADPKSED